MEKSRRAKSELIRRGLLIQANRLLRRAASHRTPHVLWRLNSSDSLPIFAAIRRKVTVARHKKRRENVTPPGEVRFEASTRKAVRQSPIIVRLGTDSVNPFRQQKYKTLVSVALKPQTACGA